MVFLRSRAEPVLSRLRKPGDLESGPASWRQQVVDVDLGAEPGDGRGEVGLPDDPARCLGLRWCERDGAHRPDDRWQDGEGPYALRPERHRLYARPDEWQGAGRQPL